MNAGQQVPALEARKVNFSFRAPVVVDFSLSLVPGIMTGIIGPNGSGKTTALRLLAGILKPTSGEILLDGTTPLRRLARREIARKIAMVPQSTGDGSQLTVPEFAMRGRSPHLPRFGFESAMDEEITMSALQMAQLSSHLDKRVCELSGGERQRLLLARALAQEPHILLMDEPFTGVDVTTQEVTLNLLEQLREQMVTVLVSTHDLNMAAARFDAVILLNHRLIAYGKPDEVFTHENVSAAFKTQVMMVDGAMVVDQCCAPEEEGQGKA